MSACEFADSTDIELFFYGELGVAPRMRVEGHLKACPECRRRLQDLHALQRALAAQPRVDAPPAGDWSGFMGRLDAARAANDRIDLAPVRQPMRSWAPLLAFAATLALVTAGVLVAARHRTTANPVAARPTAAVATSSGQRGGAPTISPSVHAGSPHAASAGRLLVEQSEEHLERSKLVVLGLTARDPRTTPSTDWEYERQLAGSLLADTRMYRLAAESRGLSDLARVMGDLETVLLEASLSDQKDPEALDRLQQLIRKRDLVVKMQVVGSSSGI